MPNPDTPWRCPTCGQPANSRDEYLWLRERIAEYESRRRPLPIRPDPDRPGGLESWWILALRALRGRPAPNEN